MDPIDATVRQRRKAAINKDQSNYDKSKLPPKLNPKDRSCDDDEEDTGGVDWKCAVLILILVFVVVFAGSVTLGSKFSLPFSLFNKLKGELMGEDKEVDLTIYQNVKEDHDQKASPKSYPTQDVDKYELIEDENIVHSGEKVQRNDKRKEKQMKPALDKPTILWWTDALFPHAHRGEIAEITCGEHTCLTTSDKRVLSHPMTRGILFYGTDFRPYEAPLPREPWHEWALLHEESPMNNYALVHSMKLFNHSGTFKRNSDYPITTHSLTNLDYLTERSPVPIEEKNKLRKQKFAPILYVQSHCDVAADRDRYVKELMKHIKVDSYGTCVNNKKIPEHLSNPVDSMESDPFYDFISKYKFHLAFENALCDDYITEKFFRPLHVGSVPIYRGSPSAQDWAPSSKSFINVNQFESPEQLATFIKLLDQYDDVYLDYLTFKDTGITNKALVDHMKNRDYAINEWNQHSFISGFECHVCKKISERYIAELDPTLPVPEKKIGDSSYMGCPPPEPSVGNIEDIPASEGIHNWIQDYWGMRDQAVALEEMIKNGAKDSSKLFEVMEKIYNDNHQP